MTTQITQIILLLAGLFIILKGKVSFTPTREIAKPHSLYLGLVFITFAALMFGFVDTMLVYVAVGITIVFSFFLSHRKTGEMSMKKDNNILHWIIFLISILAIGLIWYNFGNTDL